MVVVSGSFTDIKNKLLTISSIVKNRKFNGWPPYQPDETWFYETEQDQFVCPVCRVFEAQQFIQGDEIPFFFTRAEQVDPLHLIRPRVHQDHPELKGICRCTLDWIDPVATLQARLEAEIREVAF